MKAAIPLCAMLLAFAPVARADTVAVLEMTSHVSRAEVRASALAERVREVASRTLGDARVLAAEECSRHCDPRAAGADTVVSGELSRGGDGYLVTLQLREARSDKLLAAASATGANEDELSDAVAGAAVDLFRARNAVSAVSLSPSALPEVPQPAPLPGAVNLEADANVLIAYDEARTVEQAGTQRPDEAASAWRGVAEVGGENPYREMATERARKWQEYAEAKRAYEDQLARDTARLRKVLPLAYVTDATRLELLSRYARAYGSEKAAPLISSVPPELRNRAQLVIGCEDKQAMKCLALARAADRARDPQAAIDYLDRACAANDAEACAETGNRCLEPDSRDSARAIPALERGCGAGSAKACARLARVYEEGDGADVSLTRAADLRDQACSKGDGKSCRKLANSIDDDARATALYRKGCENGDAASCAIARASGVQQTATATTAPVKTSAPPAKLPPPSTASDNSAGIALLGLAAVAAGAAVVMAMPTDDTPHVRYGRRSALIEAQPTPSSSKTPMIAAFGGAAVLSATTGFVLLLTRHPEPEKPQVKVGLSPSGLTLSGPLP